MEPALFTDDAGPPDIVPDWVAEVSAAALEAPADVDVSPAGFDATPEDPPRAEPAEPDEPGLLLLPVGSELPPEGFPVALEPDVEPVEPVEPGLEGGLPEAPPLGVEPEGLVLPVVSVELVELELEDPALPAVVVVEPEDPALPLATTELEELELEAPELSAEALDELEEPVDPAELFESAGFGVPLEVLVGEAALV